MNIMGLSILVLALNNVSFSLADFNKLGLVIDKDTEKHLKNHQKMLNNDNNDQELCEGPISGWFAASFCEYFSKFLTCKEDY